MGRVELEVCRLGGAAGERLAERDGREAALQLVWRRRGRDWAAERCVRKARGMHFATPPHMSVTILAPARDATAPASIGLGEKKNTPPKIAKKQIAKKQFAKMIIRLYLHKEFRAAEI